MTSLLRLLCVLAASFALAGCRPVGPADGTGEAAAPATQEASAAPSEVEPAASDERHPAEREPVPDSRRLEGEPGSPEAAAAAPEPTRSGVTPTEDRLAFAVSEIVLEFRPGRKEEQVVERAWALHAALDSGREEFSSLAARVSDAPSALMGGFLGFLKRDGADPGLLAAAQALAPGRLGRPVRNAAGMRILLRHRFEEGRRLEGEHFLPVYALEIRWGGDERGGGRSKKAAGAVARAIVEGVRDGSLDFDEMGLPPGVEPPRFGGWLSALSDDAELYRAMRALPEGGVLDAIPGEEAWKVLRRGPHLRAVVREVLIPWSVEDDGSEGARAVRKKDVELALAIRSQLAPDLDTWRETLRSHSSQVRIRPDLGVLGVVGNGETSQTLDRVLISMPPNSLSEGLQVTQAGLHVVWRGP